MSQDVTKPDCGLPVPGETPGPLTGSFFVPGTCFTTTAHTCQTNQTNQTNQINQTNQTNQTDADRSARDPVLRNFYLTTALADVPRLFGSVDRNPYRPTYGCLDRHYWHYRTSSFPSEMYQEGVLPLALVYARKLPGNCWQGNSRVRELAIAAIRFAARSSHPDGSCDDYYPFERALGAAAFSLCAAAEAYRLLELDDPELLGWFLRRGRWLIQHDETGRLANHQAIAALSLLRVGEITGQREFPQAAKARIDKLLGWQSDEGWFEEYGGADPGYQTVTIDCLAKCRKLTGDAALDEPLCRAVSFALHFLHPDGSYAGEYGSRGTYHFYPHGMELLAAENAEAANLADGFLRGLAAQKQAAFGDDRMFAHRLGNLIEAYVDWSPTRPAEPGVRGHGPGARGQEPGARGQEPGTRGQGSGVGRQGSGVRGQGSGAKMIHYPSFADHQSSCVYFPKARLLVRRTATAQTVISAARGGVFKHFAHSGAPVTDAGLIVETTDGKVAVSQMHDLSRAVHLNTAEGRMGGGCEGDAGGGSVSDDDLTAKAVLSVSGPLCWARFERITPIKQAVFHTGMSIMGRWCRSLVRRRLQGRLITGRRKCPIRLTRLFEFLPQEETAGGSGLHVTDTIELTDPRIRVGRMSYGTDHQTAYVAACGVYQEAVLQPWTDLQEHVEKLNSQRRVTVVRAL